VRALEHSQASVRSDTRDTVLLLLLLTLFAVCASAYVCVHGWNDMTRSKYDLLLHCVLIVTSVIPPELPMQMALAVNASLMTLMKMQVHPRPPPYYSALLCCTNPCSIRFLQLARLVTPVSVCSCVITVVSQIFCTEPFRVPIAGKIDYCLFDKTGMY
jgi:cation-transporting ATPase 13A1